MHIYPAKADVPQGPIGKLTYSNFTDRYIEPSTKHFSHARPTECTTTSPEYIALIDNSQVTQITYTALYKHLELFCIDSLQYLHDLTTYPSTKCMKMLSGLLPIHTNSLISFHEQSSVLLHQCTTFKELLADVSSVDTIENALHRQIETPSPFLLLLLNIVIILIHL